MIVRIRNLDGVDSGTGTTGVIATVTCDMRRLKGKTFIASKSRRFPGFYNLKGQDCIWHPDWFAVCKSQIKKRRKA
jgi:hypothetical protein